MLHLYFFFFNDPATTEIYTLSLHDALPISSRISAIESPDCNFSRINSTVIRVPAITGFPVITAGSEEIKSVLILSVTGRSEEHTSELQSQSNLVCRLLLEKKKSNM